jgi:hypothetical protein
MSTNPKSHSLSSLAERTDAKLRYARLMLRELDADSFTGTDFERVHVEAIYGHVFGAWDAFLFEVNSFYNLGLTDRKVSVHQVKQAAERADPKRLELDQLVEATQETWYGDAKATRDQSHHRQGVKRHFSVGAGDDIVNLQAHGRSRSREHLPDHLEHHLSSFEDLIKRLREVRRAP